MTLKVDEHGLTVQAARPATSQTIAIGAASVQTVPFAAGPTDSYDDSGRPIIIPNNTTHVRIVATSNCWIAFGSNPIVVAGASPAIFLPAFTPEYFWVLPGERIAVIQDVGAGSLNIAELMS